MHQLNHRITQTAGKLYRQQHQAVAGNGKQRQTQQLFLLQLKTAKNQRSKQTQRYSGRNEALFHR